jgi:DNA primase
MACCPFHDDRHPSMKLDRRFHCFGCQADGDAVDYVGRLFDLDAKTAACKIADDFNIPYEPWKRESREERNARIRRTREKELDMNIRRAYAEELRQFRLKISEIFRVLHEWELIYAPSQEQWDMEKIDERFVTAIQYKARVEYILDVLDFGEDEDIYDIFKHRKEIIEYYEREITNAQQRAA